MWWQRHRSPRFDQSHLDVAGSRGVVIGYLGVEVVGDHVWTIGGPTRGRYLGLLAGARAGVHLPQSSVYGVTATMSGLGPHLAGTVSITFANGAGYERALRPGAVADAPKIAAQVAQFNAMAGAAT